MGIHFTAYLEITYPDHELEETPEEVFAEEVCSFSMSNTKEYRDAINLKQNVNDEFPICGSVFLTVPEFIEYLRHKRDNIFKNAAVSYMSSIYMQIIEKDRLRVKVVWG